MCPNAVKAVWSSEVIRRIVEEKGGIGVKMQRLAGA